MVRNDDRRRLGRRLERRREEKEDRRLILKLDFIALLFPLHTDGDDFGRLDILMDG